MYQKMLNLEGGTCEGTDAEGYPKMRDRDKTADYVKLGLAPPPLAEEEEHNENVPYVNEKKWKKNKEKVESIKLKPLTEAMKAEEEIKFCVNDLENPPANVNMQMDVHKM
jgi:hypothetical protein